MDLIDDPQPGENAHEFTVAELSGAVKRVVEGEFGRVRVRGEIGRVSRPGSGHLYFDLKDDRNVLAAVSWKGQAARLTVRPEEGMEVVATGRLTTFPGQSRYQMIVDDIRPAGVGALMAMLEKRRKALEAEGLFADVRKRPLPFLPEVIGVITSPSGAVIRDILHRLRDRFPRKVLIWPVAVQGERCAAEVANAIAGFNRMTPGGALPRPDLLIVARGGGAIEDLWGFNEEVVVRAAAASEIPLISAVGHETDTTLIDHASDRRAPTPTAAAELAVPVRVDLMAHIDGLGARLSRAAAQGLSLRGQRLRDLSRALPRAESLLEPARQRLDLADRKLQQAPALLVERKAAALAARSAVLRPATLAQQVRRMGGQLDERSGRLMPALKRRNARAEGDLAGLSGRLRPAALRLRVTRGGEALAVLERRFAAVTKVGVDRWTRRLNTLERVLDSVGYENTLKRGYAVVRDGDAVITSREGAAARKSLEIEFHDGRLAVTPAKKPPEQGSLF